MTSTGLVKRTTFEEAIAYKNPTVRIPSRTAWYERNSVYLSQFDGTHEDNDRSLLAEIKEEQEREAANEQMALAYKRLGFPYLAQGPGGPPPETPDGVMDPDHEDRAREADLQQIGEDLAALNGARAQASSMGARPMRAQPSAEEARLRRAMDDDDGLGLGDAASMAGSAIGLVGRATWGITKLMARGAWNGAPLVIQGGAAAASAVGSVAGAMRLTPRDRDRKTAHERDLQRCVVERDAAEERIRAAARRSGDEDPPTNPDWYYSQGGGYTPTPQSSRGQSVKSEAASSTARSGYGVQNAFWGQVASEPRSSSGSTPGVRNVKREVDRIERGRSRQRK